MLIIFVLMRFFFYVPVQKMTSFKKSYFCLYAFPIETRDFVEDNGLSLMFNCFMAKVPIM